jgi:hypothetical protein
MTFTFPKCAVEAALVEALLVAVQCNVPVDTQKMLVFGSNRERVPKDVLLSMIKAALTAAAEAMVKEGVAREAVCISEKGRWFANPADGLNNIAGMFPVLIIREGTGET